MKQTILIVDDSATARRMIKKDLENVDYTIIEAINGEDALIKMSETSPDLITLDLDMPVMGGFETYAEIKRNINTRSFS